MSNRPAGPVILVVEDCDDDFETVREAAEQARVCQPLLRARSSDEARATLASGVRVQMMLLDGHLPDSGGAQVVSELRGRDLDSRVPVVAFSGSARIQDRETLYFAGVDAFHLKSIDYAKNLRTLGMIFTHWLKPAK